MRLDPTDALTRLGLARHGVLCTLHPRRGPDPQPVVYAVAHVGDQVHLGIPIDRVKPKAAGRLQREVNLAADPRASLLIEHWDPDDWSQLWWVRAHLEHVPAPSPALLEELGAGLAGAFVQYADRPFDRIIVCRVTELTGWAASSPG